MSEMEKIEIERYRAEIVNDVDHLLAKYCRIMSWDIPELDQALARELVIKTLSEALAEVDKR